jgi:hypothetical protein
MNEFNMHIVWCQHRENNESHDGSFPFCYKQIHGVKLIATDGERVAPSLWVYATHAAHPDAMTSGQRAPDDHLYEGIELTVERYDGETWSEDKMRLSSDAARSLAAALVRAADVEQGLTL